MRAPRPGRDYPRTHREFYAQFGSAADCVEWLDRLRWGPGSRGFICPSCGGIESWVTGRRGASPPGRRCRYCRTRVNPLAGTPLHRARVPLPALLEAAWLMTEPGMAVNTAAYQRNARMNRENAWTILHKLREVMHALMLTTELHGIVEADEVFIGGRPRRRGTGRRGRGTTQHTVLVLVERRRGGRVRFKRVPTASATTLLPVVQEAVRCPASIRTDGNTSYAGLRGLGYRHKVYNMSALPNPAHVYLPAVHAVSANTKRWLLDAYRRTPALKHLDYYLAEYAFRFNHRSVRHRGLLFYRLMEAMLDYEQVTQRRIIGRGR